MPLADWTVPFNLTSAACNGSTVLPINQEVVFDAGHGIYLARPTGCKLRVDVRASKLPAPQEDGMISPFGDRFVTGCEMDMTVQLWQWNNGLPPEQIACDDLLQQMIDEWMCYAYGLLNAGDNEGRISWTPVGENARMLDDIRLWTYPAESQDPASPYELSQTFDCALPYSEDLTPSVGSLSGGAGTATNDGNRPTYPVWRIHGPFSGFTLSDGTNEFIYDGTLSGASTLGSSDYLEINTFRNTAYKNGSGANLTPGMVMTDSKFFLIPVGGSSITITYSGGGANNSLSEVETNSAWA